MLEHLVRTLFAVLVALCVCQATPTGQPVRRAAAKQYCTPNTVPACWPTDAQWSAFNATVGGNLIKVTPWQNPCFQNPGPFNLAACEQVKLSYNDGLTRANQVGATQMDNWEYCYTNAGEVGDCTLSAAVLQGQLKLTPEPATRQCRLGRLSPYAVAVSSAADVQAAIAFATKNNIKIVIKNTGHEYLGRSTAPDSLMIWTHNLNSLSINNNFNGNSAIVMGAGVQAEPAYRFAALNGKDITLGAYGSVGVAGGFAMGGGHGPLQPTYGLAVDNILQFTVVTANASVVTANAQQNSDLFYALRGGGGGTWGVVTETVYKVYPAKPLVAVVFNLTINPLYTQAQKLAAISDYVQNQALYEVGWRKKGWSGYTFITTSYILFSHFLPGGSVLDGTNDMAQFLLYLQTKQLAGQWVVTQNMITPFTNFDLCRELIFRLGEPQTPVAYSERLASRLISVDQYSTAASRKALGDAVAAAYGDANSNTGVPAGDVQYRTGESIQLYSTGPLPTRFGGPSGSDTGVNPAWRDSIWEVLLFVNWIQGISQAGRNAVAQKTSNAMNHVRPLGVGTYFSESDVLEPNWQSAFFGANYKKLLQIKKKWDPNNVFTVYKGVGYESVQNQQVFKCYQQA
jgi:hypothetical protein